MTRRDGSTFQNVVVDQPRRERHGLVVGGNATECAVRGGSWRTGHYPFVVEGDRELLTGDSCPLRLEGIEDLDAANLDDAETLLAAREGDGYCVSGVEGVEDADEVVVVVASQRDDGLYGRRMSAKSFEQIYENWI